MIFDLNLFNFYIIIQIVLLGLMRTWLGLTSVVAHKPNIDPSYNPMKQRG